MSEVVTIPKALFDEMCAKQERAVKDAYERGKKDAAEAFQPDIAATVGKELVNNLTFADGYKEGYADAAGNVMARFYSAVGIALHEQFRFGESRIVKVLDRAHQLAETSLDGSDLAKRLHEETGLEVSVTGNFGLPDDPEEW